MLLPNIIIYLKSRQQMANESSHGSLLQRVRTK